MPEKLNEIEIRSESVQEILSNPRSWIIRWGISVVFFALLLVVIASFFVKYPDKIFSPVYITSIQPSEKIILNSKGTLEGLFVRNHDTVVKGQVLGHLKSDANYKDVQYLKSIVNNLNYDSNTFIFPIHETENLNLGEIKSKYILFSRTYNEFNQNGNLSAFQLLISSFEELKTAVDNWEKNYLITSSVNGKVNFQQSLQKGQTFESGEVIINIIPDGTKDLYAKLIVPAQNSGKISPNQKVQIKLNNYNSKEFGIIEGKVKTVYFSSDSTGNFPVDVELINGLQTSYQKKLKYQMEMKGTAEIITEDLRIIERIFYQFKDLM